MPKQIKKKIEYEYYCENCGKPAFYNICTNYTSYEIVYDKKGNCDDYYEIANWEGDASFFCKKCAKNEKII
jgi:hypothetical protein